MIFFFMGGAESMIGQQILQIVLQKTYLSHKIELTETYSFMNTTETDTPFLRR